MANQALLIEDDESLASALKLQLADLGYAIERASDGVTGLNKALENDYAFVLLDIKLPRLEGTEVCKRLREAKPFQIIIILSSLSDELNKVLHLELGADDYVAKPFSIAELRARIKAVLRRTEKAALSSQMRELTCGPLMLDLEKLQATLEGRRLDLTVSEFRLLALLAASPGRVFSSEEIISELHGAPRRGYESAVTSHINRLRSKIEPNPAKPVYLRTVRGAGYCLAEPEEHERE